MDFSDFHYFLPTSLRSELAKPVGELVEGTIAETMPVLKERLVPHEDLLIAVGDVTAELFVQNNFDPDLIVTDGQTKREKLEDWKEWPQFTVLEATCPAAEITKDAWQTLQQAVKLAADQPVHVKIFGEEDLLVLPLIIELPQGSIIVYGQPSRGAVIRVVDQAAKNNAKQLIQAMDKKR